MRVMQRVLAVLCLVGIVACQTTKVAPAPNLLRVGVTANSPPMVFKERGEIKGLEADFAAELGRELQRSVTFVDLAWDELIPALENNEIDIIMSNMSITPGRQMRVSFVEPYLQVGQTLLVRRDDARTYRFPQTIAVAEVKVGVDKGTTGDMFTQQYCRRAERVEFRSVEQAVASLKRGKVDVVIHDAPVVWQQAALNEAEGLVPVSRPLTEEYLAWAVSRDDHRLREEVSRARQKMLDSGVLDRLIKHWVPFYTR